jgi:phage terminase large subunit-like protein
MPTTLTIKDTVSIDHALDPLPLGRAAESKVIELQSIQSFTINDITTSTQTYDFQGSDWQFNQNSYESFDEIPPVAMMFEATGLSESQSITVSMNPESFGTRSSLIISGENPTVFLHTRALWAFLASGWNWYDDEGAYRMSIRRLPSMGVSGSTLKVTYFTPSVNNDFGAL